MGPFQYYNGSFYNDNGTIVTAPSYLRHVLPPESAVEFRLARIGIGTEFRCTGFFASPGNYRFHRLDATESMTN